MYHAMLLKPVGGRRAQYLLAVLLHEILNDQVVRFALGNMRVEFLEHGPGRRAVDVIALRENLPAAAHAHQLRAQHLGAVGFLRLHMQGNQRRGDPHERGKNQGETASFSHFFGGPQAEPAPESPGSCDLAEIDARAGCAPPGMGATAVAGDITSTAWRFGRSARIVPRTTTHAAEPNPLHQRIQVGVDHRKIGIRIGAGVDHVQVFPERRGNRHHGPGLLVGRIKTPRGIEHHHGAAARSTSIVARSAE